MALEGIKDIKYVPLENLHFKDDLALTLHPFISTRTRTPKREHAKRRGGYKVEARGGIKLSLNAPKIVLHFYLIRCPHAIIK